MGGRTSGAWSRSLIAIVLVFSSHPSLGTLLFVALSNV
jgi:hypothetical protein